MLGKSKQIIDTRELATMNDIVEPFISFDALAQYYYHNVYHQRAIKLKARVLSNIKDGNLKDYVENPQEFLYDLILNLETFGNAFIEKAGTSSNYSLYTMPTMEGRIDIHKGIHQHIFGSGEYHALDGYLIKYSSLFSRFYGEPDYLSVLEQISTSKEADRYNQAFFKNGAKPSKAIIFENSSPNQKQIDGFRDYFGTNFKGYDNAHKTLVMHTGKSPDNNNAKIRLEDMGKIDDLSFEKLKKVSRDEIIASHGVPPRLVGVVDSGGLGGGGELMGQLHLFNELEITPKIGTIEAFFKGIGINLELSKLDTTNLKSDADIASSLVASGILTQQEAKDLLQI